MRKDLFEEFCREYTLEMNRLRMAGRAGTSQARTELARVEREVRKLVEAIKSGVSALAIKDELLALEARQAELKLKLEEPEAPPLVLPSVSDRYREKVSGLCHALEGGERGLAGAREAIRGLIDEVSLEPDGDHLRIILKGNLAGCCEWPKKTKGRRRPTTFWTKYSGCGGGI